MVARYISRAIDVLHTTVANNYATYLAAVEVDEGLANNTIPRPVKYYKGLAPDLNFNPIVFIYAETIEPYDIREKIWRIECKMALKYRGTSIEDGQKMMDRYASACIDMIYANLSLGNTVIEAIPGKIDTLFATINESDDSDTLFILTFDISILYDRNGV